MQFIICIIVLLGIVGHGAMLFASLDLILYYSWAFLDTGHSKLKTGKLYEET